MTAKQVEAQQPTQNQKKRRFTQTFSKSSRELLRSPLWHRSGTQRKLFRSNLFRWTVHFGWIFCVEFPPVKWLQNRRKTPTNGTNFTRPPAPPFLPADAPRPLAVHLPPRWGPSPWLFWMQTGPPACLSRLLPFPSPQARKNTLKPRPEVPELSVAALLPHLVY